MATVKVLNEVAHPGHAKDGWHMVLQHATVGYRDGRSVKAYRFICRNGHDKTEHEAHFPSLADAEQLIQLARKAGWGNEGR